MKWNNSGGVGLNEMGISKPVNKTWGNMVSYYHKEMDSNTRYIKRSIPKELWMQCRLKAFSERKTITTWITLAMAEKLGVTEILFVTQHEEKRLTITEMADIVMQSIPREIWMQARAQAIPQEKTITSWIAEAMREKLDNCNV